MKIENAHKPNPPCEASLERTGGVRRKAAEILGISYRGLGKKMARLGIEGPRKKV